MTVTRKPVVAGVACYVVCGTIHGAEFIKYVCETRENAERLAGLLNTRQPTDGPYSVHNWKPSQQQAIGKVYASEDHVPPDYSRIQSK